VHHHSSYAARRCEQPDDVILLCDDCHIRRYETSTAAKIAGGIEDVREAERCRSPRAPRIYPQDAVNMLWTKC
jgi:hypothetical protein